MFPITTLSLFFMCCYDRGRQWYVGTVPGATQGRLLEDHQNCKVQPTICKYMYVQWQAVTADVVTKHPACIHENHIRITIAFSYIRPFGSKSLAFSLHSSTMCPFIKAIETWFSSLQVLSSRKAKWGFKYFYYLLTP